MAMRELSKEETKAVRELSKEETKAVSGGAHKAQLAEAAKGKHIKK
jgi:hypothetical protein